MKQEHGVRPLSGAELHRLWRSVPEQDRIRLLDALSETAATTLLTYQVDIKRRKGEHEYDTDKGYSALGR